MRIQERPPRSLMGKAAAFFSKRKFGKVIAPLRSIYAVQPALLGVVLKIAGTQKKLSLDEPLRRLISAYVSTLNQCPFCTDVDLRMAEDANVEKAKLKKLLNFRNEAAFNQREKAMLAYCEEVTLTKQCTDETFANLKRHFSEKEIVEITWLNAVANYFNLQAMPLGLSSDQVSETGKA